MGKIKILIKKTLALSILFLKILISEIELTSETKLNKNNKTQ